MEPCASGWVVDLDWDDIRLFLAIAERGSLTRAARALGLGQPTVTRRLADLEYRLGTPLFRRSSEGATLTDTGSRLLEPARQMATWAGEVGRMAEVGHGGPAGRVRVTTTPSLATDVLAPLAGRLAAEGSGLRLEVSASVRFADLARGEAELALRSQAADAADLVNVRSWAFDVGVYASPELAARLGPCPRVEDLPWIAWCAPYESLAPNPQLSALIPGFRPAFAADDYLVQIAGAEAGAGVITLAGPLRRLRTGSRLVALPVDLGPYGRTSLHLVCARSALAIPRVRAVADRLIAVLDAAT